MSHFCHYVILPMKLADPNELLTETPRALGQLYQAIPEPSTEDVPIARASRWSLAVQNRPTWQSLAREAPADDEVNAVLDRLMAPFSEELRVPEYEKDCYCVGGQAMHRAGFLSESDWPRCEREAARLRLLERAGVRHYSSSEFQELFKDEERFAAYQEQVRKAEEPIADHWHTLWDSFEALQPDKGQPDPDCSECHGSGIEKSTYNPASKWDWWVVGGRWNGVIMDAPRDSKGELAGFNFGDEFHQLAENLAVAGELAGREDTRWVPFSILTPEGEWIEKGKMGWFGMAANEKPEDDWRQQARNILQRYADHWVVGVDCHI